MVNQVFPPLSDPSSIPHSSPRRPTTRTRRPARRDPTTKTRGAGFGRSPATPRRELLQPIPPITGDFPPQLDPLTAGPTTRASDNAVQRRGKKESRAAALLNTPGKGGRESGLEFVGSCCLSPQFHRSLARSRSAGLELILEPKGVKVSISIRDT